MHPLRPFSRSAFTLIELLVVIAIIAVLSVVVVLSLNPAELLRQSRDANRLSDLSTLNSALALYTTDQAGVSGFSLGNASSVYVSLPDSSSTCGTWNLPALSAGYTYACAASTSSKNINNTGWIPVNFSNISGGAPFSNLPLDGTNQSSTGLYYTYYSNGSQFIVTAIPESQKQKTALGTNAPITSYPDVMANGSSLNISPLFNASSLAGYWNFDEGTGTTIADLSGNNNPGTWYGNASGTSGYYSAGKTGMWAGTFDGTSTYVFSSKPMTSSSGVTFSLWFYEFSINGNQTMLAWDYQSSDKGYEIENQSGNTLAFRYNPTAVSYTYTSVPASILAGRWYHLAITYNQSTTTFYLNGTLVGSPQASAGQIYPSGGNLIFGMYPSTLIYKFYGLLDDVRIYNRILSLAEIQAIYNAEK